MTRKVRAVLLLVISLTVCVFLFSCSGDESKLTFALSNEMVTDGVHTISVSSETDSINLDDYIIISSGAKLKLYSSSDMDKKIDHTVSLQTGSNLFYVRVKDGTAEKDYTINIIRKKTVNISFDSNGGSFCESIIVDEGTVITAPATSKTGYNFVKWDYDFSLPVTSDISAKAEWTPKTYTVTIHMSDNDSEELNVTFGENYNISVAERLGYRFIGVRDAKGRDFSLSGKWLEADNIDLIAEYLPITYKITYVYNAKIDNKSIDYNTSSSVTLETPIHPDGLEFDGWYSNPQLTDKVEAFGVGNTGNKVFYAKWKQNITVDDTAMYSVTIDADGFDFDGMSFEIKYGMSYTLPVVPEREKYDFVSWMADDTVVPTSGAWSIRDDVVLTIKWTPKVFSIEYIIDSKTTNPNTVTKFTTEDDDISILDATRPNAIFKGWYTADGERVTQISKGTLENVILYAEFDITGFVLTYNPNGGTASKESVVYEIGEAYELLTPERPGYKFKGWYNGDQLIEDGTWNFTDDVTVVAKWERLLYLITYELLGGSTEEALKNAYSVEDTFTLPTPTRDGYAFLGWTEEGTGKTYQSVTIQKGTIGGKKFIANWSIFTYSYTENTATVVSYVYTSDRTSVIIPKSVNYNGIDYTVTEIGASVFEGMGEKLEDKEIVGANGKPATKFSVEIPNTLQKIGINAFYDCNDVTINVIMDAGVSLSEWADSLKIADGNDHVLDVIKGNRPAIGWTVYS